MNRQAVSKNMTTSLRTMYFLGFAFAFGTFYGCRWNISTVKTIDVFQQVIPAVIDFQTVVDITAFVKERNIYVHGMDSEGTHFAYPYSFWLSIECQNKAYTRLMSRQAVTRGLLPFIYICVNKYRSNKATVCSAYQGAMFDPKEIGCIKGDYCLPFWMVPVVVDSIIMEITVKTHGLGWPLHHQQFVFGLTNFTVVQLDRLSTSTNEYNEMKLMKYVSMQCTVLLLGPFGDNKHFLISTDDFVTIHSATFEQLIPEEQRRQWSSVCACDTVVDGAAVAGDIILISEFGTIVSSGKSANRVLNKCVKEMTLTTVSEHAFLILYGGCAEEGKVFVSSKNILTGLFTNTVLIDSNDTSPCFVMAASDRPFCKVINIAACTERNNYFALVSVEKATEVQKYAIMFYTGYRWMLLAELMNTVPATELLNSSLLLEKKSISVVLGNNLYASEALKLFAFKIAPFTSHHIYLYGSHILHSPDFGRHFYLLPVKLEGMVKFMLVSRSGFLVAITGRNVIWSSLAGLSELYQIYPSSVSENALQLLNLTIPPISAQIVSAFFDLHDELRVLAYSSGSGVVNYVMPLVKLFYYHRQNRNDDASSADQIISSVATGCLFSNLRFDLPHSQLYSRQLDHTYYAPSTFGGKSYDKTSFLIYHALLQKVKSKQRKTYQDFKQVILDYTEANVELQLKPVNKEQHYSQFLYQNEHVKDMEHLVNPDDFSWDDTKRKSEIAVELPEMIYLNHGDSYNFTCILTLADSGNETLYVPQMDQIDLYIRLSDAKEVSAFATKRKFSNNNTLTFEVSLVNIGPVTWQNMPGGKLYPVTVDISVANSSLRCFKDINGNMLPQGYYHTTVMIGCPPALVIEFDWEASIQKLENSSTSFSHDCLYSNPTMYCFDFLEEFYPHFNIIDMATGSRSPYTGNYTLRVVSTATKAQADPHRFTDVEIHKYNNMNSTPDALIWKPHLDHLPVVDGWPVYNMSTNAVRWFCYRNSPCSRVRPYFPSAAELYFLVEFSNAFIPSSDTRCDYTMNFWIRLHGLPLDPLYQRLPVVAFVFLMIIALCGLFFICHHNNMGVYMSFCAICTKYWKRCSR